MVIIKWVVPPAAVLLLQRKKDMGEMGPKVLPFGFWQLVDAQGGVPVAVVVEITGHVEERLVRDRAFAADAEPTIAGKQPVEPGLENFVSDALVAVHP